MKVILSRSKTFIHDEGKTHTASNNPGPQTVPDWAADTNTFKLGLQDGSILVIEVLSPAPSVAPPAPLAPPAGLQVPDDPTPTTATPPAPRGGRQKASDSDGDKKTE